MLHSDTEMNVLFKFIYKLDANINRSLFLDKFVNT